MEKTLQFKQMNRAIISWFRFGLGCTVLCVEDNDALSSMLLEQGLSCVSTNIQNVGTLDASARYDYIIAIDRIIERTYSNVEFWTSLYGMLSPNGIMFIGAENRFGLKYFCGDRDPYMNDVFHSIEGYSACASSELEARLLGRGELENLLKSAGIAEYAFYSVLPNVQTTQLIYRDGVLPNESLGNRYLPKYNYPDTVFMHEAKLYDGIVSNGLFHAMANSFLIECRKETKAGKLGFNSITLTAERDEDEAFATIITDDEHVIKRALNEKGIKHLETLIDNHKWLNAHGIKTIDDRMDGNDYVMPFVHAESAYSYLRRLIISDPEAAKAMMDEIYEMILKSSELSGESDMGPLLKRGYVDLVPWNCFVIDGEFVFYDQEFYIEDCPAKCILFRWIEDVYAGNKNMDISLPIDFFWEKYGMAGRWWDYFKVSLDFCVDLRNENELRSFLDNHSGNPAVINDNRAALNTPVPYKNLFDNPFPFDEGKNIYIFGIDWVTDKYIAFYGRDYKFAGILTNDESRWGTTYMGLPVYEPTHFFPEDREYLTVVIACEDYAPVYKQMVAYSCYDIRAYSVHRNYPGRQVQIARPSFTKNPKKYHVGYFKCKDEGCLHEQLKYAHSICDYVVMGILPGNEAPVLDESIAPDEIFYIPKGWEHSSEALQKFGFNVVIGENNLEQWEHDYIRNSHCDQIDWPK